MFCIVCGFSLMVSGDLDHLLSIYKYFILINLRFQMTSHIIIKYFRNNYNKFKRKITFKTVLLIK